MSSRAWLFRIHDIIQAIGKIELFTAEMTASEFAKNDLVIDAVIRNLEIIGEASKSIPTAIQTTYPEIPWKEMNAMRNILIHEYFGVDVKTVWHTVKKHLPALKKQLNLIILRTNDPTTIK